MTAAAADSPTDLLAFFQILFPEEIYAFGETGGASGAVGAAPAAPVAVEAPPVAVIAAAPVVIEATPVVVAPAVAPVPALPAPEPAVAVAVVEPVVLSPPSLPSVPMPTTWAIGTSHQQSRGDGSGAIIVQRLPPTAFAQLNKDEFWQKFLQFLGLDWTNVRFINVLQQEPLPLPDLLASVPGATRLLLFGSGLVTPLPHDSAAYDPYPLPDGGPLLVRAHAVADLTNERKKLLLGAVKDWK
jgi:hypothetical protein